jgi:hypothetical protein
LKVCGLKLLLQIIVVFTASLWLAMSPASAETSNVAIKVDQSFDHTRTKFPLEGAHKDVTCETCHAGAVFKGVPTACANCHNGDFAKGKPGNHPKSTAICVDCHNQSNFAQVHVDHSKISKDCFSCHDGRVATGKNKTHVKSAKTCEDCHVTTTWHIARFDHNQTNEPCESCHDRLHASGKPFVHIRSNNDCATCHKVEAWTIGVFDHTGIVDGCFACHDGLSATGKNPTHIKTSNTCESCHTTVTWTKLHFDHLDPPVAAAACKSCHTGGMGNPAAGKSAQHFNVLNTSDCGGCHTTKAWAPTNFDHQLAANLSNCYSCHNNAHPPALGKNPGHIASQNTCTDCHSNTNFVSWKGAAFDHVSAGIIDKCFTCHNGTVRSGKSANHLLHTTNTCENCHGNTNFKNWLTTSSKDFKHTEIAGGTCFSCHDGTKSISLGPVVGKSNIHLPTTENCDVCHTTDKFVPGKKFDHSEMAVPACFSCHDGKTGISTASPLRTKGPTHIVAANDCESCHTSFVNWNTITFDHAGITNGCFSCHDGKSATGKSATHLLTSNTCESCHVVTTWVVAVNKFDHNDPMVVGVPCATCHNGTIATGKSATHVTTSDNCAACHTSANWTVAPASFDHTDPGVAGKSCETCHNGTNAKGKNATHILTLNVCKGCHTDTTSWKLAANQVDHSLVIGTCFSCHDNAHNTASFTPIMGKTATHLKTSNLCAVCHTTTTWNPAVRPVDHTQVQGTCFSCHNNTAFKGKSSNHVSTSNDCALCHVTTTWMKPNVRFDHTDTVVAAATCVSCHNGTNPLAFGKAAAPAPGHIVSSDNCADCHTTIAFTPAHIDHSDPGVASQLCSSCHGVTAKGKPVTHSPTPVGSDCKDCHTTVSWITNAKPDHTSFVGNCFSCHNGTTTAKFKPPTHFVTSNNCDLCHNTDLFKPAVFDHRDTLVAGKPCASCHDGNHSPALGKSSAAGGHLVTSNACETCHVGFTTWVTTIKFPHNDPVVAAATCVSCHDGNHAPAVGKSVTHFKTSTDCASCHAIVPAWVVGVGKFNHADPVSVGVPCFTCHTGTHLPAVGKNAGHVASGNICGDCHTTVAWKPAHFDHTAVAVGTCFTCHNGTRATGKNVGHFATNNTCDNCHATPPTMLTWKPVTKFDHGSTTGTCFSCHNGARPPAVGKNATHIASSNACETCHTSFTVWKPVTRVDHSQVTGTCFSCHNGTKATGKNPTHFATTNTCENCHNKDLPAWKPALKPFDHTSAIGSCVSCHDGAHAPAAGKSVTHIKTTTFCDSCHSTTSWTATLVDHTQVTGTCFSCHNVTVWTGKTTFGPHFNTTNTCDACHNSRDTRTKSPAAWTVAKTAFDHTQTTATCVSCHAVGAKPAAADVKASPPHIATTTACINCHTTVNWTAQVVDHTQVTGACVTCHDGKVATGKLSISGIHFNTTNACISCHATRDTRTKAATAWIVTKTAFDHSQAIGTCISCHTAGAKPVADVKSAGHFITTQPCEACHTTTNWTTLLNYSHASPAYVLHYFGTTAATCITCHKQNNEKITFTSPGLVPDCAACHSNKYVPDPHKKFGNTLYTVSELRDCTGACHIYTDSSLTKIQTNRATNPKHRATSRSWN